jgi:hypothetical protein
LISTTTPDEQRSNKRDHDHLGKITYVSEPFEEVA